MRTKFLIMFLSDGSGIQPRLQSTMNDNTTPEMQQNCGQVTDLVQGFQNILKIVRDWSPSQDVRILRIENRSVRKVGKLYSSSTALF